MTNDQKTVVGVFEDYNKADQVVRELTNNGIPRDAIDIRSNFMTGTAGHSSSYSEEHEHEGGISGFFHRLFGSDDSEAGHYAEAHRRGNAIVAVNIGGDQIERVVDIMNAGGAVDIDRQVANFRQTGYEKYDESAPPYTYDQATSERERWRNANAGAAIPVVEEELQVGKRTVQRGGVRVYSRVTEEPATEEVELREEHVRVDRRPVDRTLSPAEADGLRDQSIEVTEMVEEPVVQKRARVREEVVVGKETTRRTQKVSDTVKRTKVEVEQLGAEAAQGTEELSQDFRRDWEQRYADSGDTWESYQPAYEYGYRSASDPRYQGRNWSDVEEDLRTDYLRNNQYSAWDRTKGAIRYGWEKVTGKR